MEVAVKPPDTEVAKDGTSVERLQTFGSAMRGIEISDQTRDLIGEDAWREFTQHASAFCTEAQTLDAQTPPPTEDYERIRAWAESASRLYASTSALLAIASEKAGHGSGVPSGQ